MTSMKTLLASAALACAFVLPAAAQQITGAGATFPAPVYGKWGEAAKTAIGVELNYQAIGSGGGIKQITEKTVDFGATDAPMNADELKKAPDLQHIPMVMGAVVVVFNAPGLKTLKLTPETLAGIFLGKITKWNDPKLVEMNRGVEMPNIAIAPVYRADGSGTSFVFTSYLSEVSAEWKSKVGASTSVKWPTGAGARGNDGVAGTVKNTRGGIGYVENAYATQNKLTTTQLRNKAGSFVKPTLESFEAAASTADWTRAPNYAVSLVDQCGAQSWPIVSATFLLVPRDPKEPAREQLVLKWVNWAYDNGGQIARQLEYIPLPKAVQDRVRATWKSELAAK
ncbi:MAG: phosphate ABC transporter substrate-binding protein PstS [Acetobacteraceae bacterium]